MFQKFNRFDPAFPIRFYDADDSGGGDDSNSGADGRGNDNPNKDNNAGKGSSVDLAVQAQLIDLTAKHGSVDAVAKYLIKRNHTLEQGRTSGLPKADKEAFDAFKALNMSVAAIEAMKAEYGPLKQGAVRASRGKELEKAAPDLSYNPTALKRLAPDLDVISKEVDVKGEDEKFTKQKRWFFKDGDKETEISAYFADDAEALSLLKVGVSAESTNNPRVPIVASQSRPYVPQGGSSGKNQNSDPIEQRRQQREQQRQNNPNALMPQPKAVSDTRK